MDQLKCGRITYDLVDGDTIMDNGNCLQLVTREVRKGWNCYPPRVPKKEFKRFKEMPLVKKDDNHSFGDRVTLWRYYQQSQSDSK